VSENAVTPGHAKQPDDVVILSGARTPVSRFAGALAGVTATELGAVAICAAVERAGVNADDIAEVLMGQVVSAGSGQAPARQAGMAAGLPAAVGATTLSKMCASGLKAVMLAAQAIRAADADLLVAGGMENMSAVPFILPWARRGSRLGNKPVVDALIQDGLRCSLQGWMMGEAAEFISAEYGLTREELDEFALLSHRKAVAAMDAGKFTAEIVPVPVKARDGTTSVVKQDEAPRRETSLPALAKLPPAFVDDGIVTAGNSPGGDDGAAALVEIVRGLATSDQTTATAVALSETLGKTPVEANDSPGFISNRILCPMVNEAVCALVEGVGTPEAIDAVMKLGINHPMGPLEQCDLVGIDVLLHVMEVLHRDLGEDKSRPCPLLRKMVAAGRLGRKTGRGFCEYA
jgi:acetyl-CoA C-acetyltransferase|tara:strand:- start:4706 stop:5917 length:1212 start_codon:yes stop_codon:yes gene_type:complete